MDFDTALAVEEEEVHGGVGVDDEGRAVGSGSAAPFHGSRKGEQLLAADFSSEEWDCCGMRPGVQQAPNGAVSSLRVLPPVVVGNGCGVRRGVAAPSGLRGSSDGFTFRPDLDKGLFISAVDSSCSNGSLEDAPVPPATCRRLDGECSASRELAGGDPDVLASGVA